MVQLGPHISQELQEGVRVIVETKYGVLRGGRTTNGAAIFLGEHDPHRKIQVDLKHGHPEVPYALPPTRFTDAHPLSGDYRYEDKDYIYETKRGVLAPSEQLPKAWNDSYS